MTPDEFTGVNFNDIDSSGIRISKSSQVFVFNSTEIALNTAQSTYFMNQETTNKTIVTCMRESRKVDNKPAKIRNLHISVLYIFCKVKFKSKSLS